MRAVTSDGVERWTRGLGLAALVVLAWSALAPDGPFWTAVLAALLVSSVLAAAFLVRSRPGPWRR